MLCIPGGYLWCNVMQKTFQTIKKIYKMYDLLHNITLKQTRACWRPNNIMNSEKE